MVAEWLNGDLGWCLSTRWSVRKATPSHTVDPEAVLQANQANDFHFEVN